MKNILYLALISALITGCYSGDNINDRLNSERMKNFSLSANSSLNISTSDPIEINPSNVERSFGSVSSVFLNRSYIELKTPQNIIIGKISKMKISNGFILILDDRISKSAYLFKENGDFMFKVGTKGRGPGEHDDPIDIEFRDAKIFITDRSFSIYEYDLSNRFVSKSEIPFFSHSMYMFADGQRAFSNNTTGYEDLNFQVIILDGSNITERFLKNTGSAISKYTSQPLSNNRSIHGDSFLFFQPWGTDIYQMSQDTVKLRYQIVSDNPIPEDMFREGRNLEEREGEYTFLYNWRVLETKNQVLFRVLHRGSMLTMIHDKERNTITAYNGISDDLLYGGVSDFPIYSHEEYFYVPLEVEQLYAVKQELADITDEKLISELKEARPEVFKLLEGMNELSNPIIMKCEM